VRRLPNQVYTEILGHRPLEVDLYLPPGPGPAPAIVYLHGGGWRRGSRQQVLPALGPGFYASLAQAGFVVATADYRLSGEATFPAPLHDVRAAIGWLRTRPEVDPDRVYLWGESAGAHLALLAALGAGLGAGLGVEDSARAVQGVVAWFPPTDLLGLPDDVDTIGGAADRGPDSREAQLLGAPAAAVPDLARAASPVSFACSDAPPILLMHGEADDMVPARQSIRLADALTAAGAPVELELIPGARHMWVDASDVPAIVKRSLDFLTSLR
jgi:acetyl esterase/lipase